VSFCLMRRRPSDLRRRASLQSRSCCRFEFGGVLPWLPKNTREVVVSVKALDSQIPSGRGHLDNISLFSKKKENNISRFGLVGRITYFR